MTDYVSPNWGTSALVVIDLQNDFLDDGAAAIPGTTAVVRQAAHLAALFRDAGRPVVHVVRLYEPGGSDVDRPRRDSIENGARVISPGSHGSQIPRATLFEASERDFRKVLVRDAVSQTTDARLEDCERIGVTVLSTKQVAAEIAVGDLRLDARTRS